MYVFMVEKIANKIKIEMFEVPSQESVTNGLKALMEMSTFPILSETMFVSYFTNRK